MKAARGDLVVVETAQHDYVLGEGSSVRTRFEVGVVTNITRDGIVKKAQFHASGCALEIPSYWHVQKTYVVSKDEFDVAGAAQAVWANPWPQGQPGMPFDSLDGVRDTIKAYRL